MTVLRTLVLTLLASVLGSTLQASPFTLYYTVTDTGSGYDYSFNLVADDNDGTLGDGATLNWFIIGDALSSASPITEGASFFTSIPSDWFASSSGGGHNGPTLCYSGSCGATPATFTLGDTLSFTGHSATLLESGQLLWSTLSGSPRTDFAVAVLGEVTSVPLPAGLPLLVGGLAALGLVARRKRAA